VLVALSLAPPSATIGIPAAVAASIAATVAVVFGIADGVGVAVTGAIAFALLNRWGAGELAAIGLWPVIVAAVGLFARRIELHRIALRQLVEAQEEERRALAHTLQDDSAQTLTGALLTLRAAKPGEPASEQTTQAREPDRRINARRGRTGMRSSTMPRERFGTRLAYRRWGSHGTPIVLVGGFVEPSWVWHAVGRLLGRRHRVYALDLPPFGYSQRRGPFTLAHWSQLVEGFDRRLGIRKPVLVGHSLGAAVAVSIAAQTPHTVAGIVLLDGDALPGGSPGWFSHLLLPAWYTTLYRIATGWDWLFRKGLKGAWGAGTPPFTAAFIDEWQRPFRVIGTAAAFASILGNGIQGVSASVLSHLPVTALVAWGSHDTVDSVAAGRRTAKLMHAPFVELAGAGHLSMLARPGLVADAIERVAH